MEQVGTAFTLTFVTTCAVSPASYTAAGNNGIRSTETMTVGRIFTSRAAPAALIPRVTVTRIAISPSPASQIATFSHSRSSAGAGMSSTRSCGRRSHRRPARKRIVPDCRRRSRSYRRGGSLWSLNRIDQATRLVERFAVFLLGIRIGQDPAAGAEIYSIAFRHRGSDGDIRIKRAGDAPVRDRSQYTLRCDGSSSAIISIARTLGAPVIEPPGNAARSRSSASAPGASWPTTPTRRKRSGEALDTAASGKSRKAANGAALRARAGSRASRAVQRAARRSAVRGSPGTHRRHECTHAREPPRRGSRRA